MTRRFSGDKLVVATHNQGKLAEFRTLLSPFVKDIISSGELGLGDVEETGSTFLENATIKALAAARAAGVVVLADDSGLCVTALNNQPGIYTARWGVGKDMRPGMERINAELGKCEDRSAFFVCTLVLAWPDGHTEHVEGKAMGTIVWPPRGEQGHGYDPVFQPLIESRTFAEMNEVEKNTLSHRGKAFRQLVEKFFA